MNLVNQKVLVTGGAGFIGSHLVELLLQNNNEVFVVDDLSVGKKAYLDEAAKFTHVSITEYKEIRDLVGSIRPDVVFHLAAKTSVVQSMKDPLGYLDCNVKGSVNLFSSCIENGVKGFVFASSGGAIYGEQKTTPTTEHATPNPLSPYGTSKLVTELYLDVLAKNSSTFCVSLRYANVYGPRQTNEKGGAIVPSLLTDALKGHTTTIYGDGTQGRDFVYVKDVAKATYLASSLEKTVVLNIASGKTTTVNELIENINKNTDFNLNVSYVEGRAGEVKQSSLSTSLTKKVMSWEPEVGFREGIKESVSFYKELLKHS